MPTIDDPPVRTSDFDLPEERFSVSVFYRGEEQRKEIYARLFEVNPLAIHIYNGRIEGIANAVTLKALRKRGLIVVVENERSGGLVVMKQEDDDIDDIVRRLAPPETHLSMPMNLPMRTSDPASPESGSAMAHEQLKPRQAEGHEQKLRQLSESAKAFREAQSGDAAAPSILSADLQSPEQIQVYNVLVSVPARARYRTELQKIGNGVCSYEAPNIYRMFLSTGEWQKVRRLSFVTDIDLYGLEESVTQALLDAISPAKPKIAGGSLLSAQLEADDTFDLLLHREQDGDRVISAIVAAGGQVTEAGSGVLRFAIRPDEGALGALAELPEVRKLTPWRPPKLFADQARSLIGVEAINATGNGHLGSQYTGKDEIVGIFDSGVDATHPDLKTRIKCTVSYQNCPVVDTFGHGTHVAGIVAGTGDASQGKIRGIAPGAQLVIVGMVGTDSRLKIPCDIGELLIKAVDYGAKVINLSWGDKFASAYEPASFLLDKFVYEHEEVLVVVAAGNSGTVEDGRYVFSSIGTPATAKNALSVGASGNDHAEIPNLWSDPPNGIAVPPGDFRMSDADRVGVQSSRGPTDFDSVKPDVCACGIYVRSTRAAHATMQFLQPDFVDFNNSYGYLGGTSMAAPVVSGAAAVLREYLRVALDMPNPSAALLKAILIASAHRLKKITAKMGDPYAGSVGFPDFHQGFGRIDLASVVPHPGAPANRRLLMEDIYNGTDRGLSSAAEPPNLHVAARSYQVEVAANAVEPVRVTLAWTDFPGRSLHSNLQLYVEAPGKVYVGNADFVYHRDAFAGDALSRGKAPTSVKLGGVPFDKHNNVQQITIEKPAAGDYRITILAQYTDPGSRAQGYGLCVSGELDSLGLVEV